MAFTDEDVLVLLELDFEPSCPPNWRRLRAAAWWAAVVAGAVAATYLLHAGYGLIPTRFGG